MAGPKPNYQALTLDCIQHRVMWPRLFCILTGDQDWAGVHGKVWAWPGTANPSLLSTGHGPARPTPIPYFYRQGLAPNPSLLLARPLTSIGQTSHFYQPDPSLLLAKSGRAMPDRVGPCRAVSGTVPDRAVPILAVSPCRPDTGTPFLMPESPDDAHSWFCGNMSLDYRYSCELVFVHSCRELCKL